MKKLLCLILSAALVLTLTACGAAPAASVETHTVTDHLGNAVEVPVEIDRIVVCDILPLPSVLSVFFDSAEKIVGMPGTAMSAAENGLLGALYPEILDAETGFIDGSSLNIEELMKLQPDVVFYNSARTEQAQLLEKAGIPAVAVSVSKWDYDCMETLKQWAALLAQMFPENDRAEAVAAYSQKIYDLVQQRTAEIPEKERVFFLYKYTDTGIMTSGGRFFGQWWADAMGADHVASAVDADNQITVNMEQIYDWNPGLIFITNFTEATPEDLYENSVGVYDWSAIQAVENRQVYKMPLGMYRSYTPGADTPVTLLWLAKTAYPEAFADIDIIAEAKSYYQEVFGIALTDDQAASIFAPSADAGAGF